jgi:GxxExxY protein
MPKSRSKSRRDSLIQTLREHACVVMNTLGRGHSERVYHRAIITSLNKNLIPHRSEVIAPIYFMDEIVGFGRCDLIIGNLVVEFKANKHCPCKHGQQIQKYLESMSTTKRASYKGVIINFNQRTGAVELHSVRLKRR